MSPEFLDLLHAAAQGAKIWTVNLDRKCTPDNGCWCDDKWKYDWEKTIKLYTQYIFMRLKKQHYVAGDSLQVSSPVFSVTNYITTTDQEGNTKLLFGCLGN